MPTNLDPVMVDTSKLFLVNTAKATSLTATNAQITNGTISNLVATNATTTDTSITNLTATGNIVTNFFVVTANSSYTFLPSDNSKVYHINTGATQLTASFPVSLPNGFNVSIINTGTGIINLSSNTAFNATGTLNSVQYSGIFIYKTNNQFYGIGVFE